MMAVRKKLILRNTVKENALINVKLWNYKVSKELMENVSIFTLFEKSQDWGQNDCLTFSYIKRLLQIIQRNVIEFNFKRRRREAFYEACIWIFSDFRIIIRLYFLFDFTHCFASTQEWSNLYFYWILICKKRVKSHEMFTILNTIETTLGAKIKQNQMRTHWNS